MCVGEAQVWEVPPDDQDFGYDDVMDGRTHTGTHMHVTARGGDLLPGMTPPGDGDAPDWQVGLCVYMIDGRGHLSMCARCVCLSGMFGVYVCLVCMCVWCECLSGCRWGPSGAGSR